MSWVSEKDFFEWGLGKTRSQKGLFNKFWDTPARRAWADDNEEDYLIYLSVLDEKVKQEQAKPNDKSYEALLERLDPVPKAKSKPLKKGFTLEELEAKAKEDAKAAKAAEKAAAKKAKSAPAPAPEPKKTRAETKAELDEEFPDLEELSEKDMPHPESGTCSKNPRRPATSVRQTKMAMRGPNPNRKGWKLPRKPYGHSRMVVELEDDLTDAEMKKMTSELPRRCLVNAVQDWAKEHEKIVLPSITRADKAEIVATIKEHRIPVPRMSGGYYGDGMDDLMCGGQIHTEVHLCSDCCDKCGCSGDDPELRGKGAWDDLSKILTGKTLTDHAVGYAQDKGWLPKPKEETIGEKLANWGINQAVSGISSFLGGADPNPEDRKRGRDVPIEESEEDEESMEDADEESEDDFGRDIAFVCSNPDCGVDVYYGTPEYAGRTQLDDGSWLCGNCADNMPAEEGSDDGYTDEEDDDEDDLPPFIPPPLPRHLKGEYQGGSISPFFHLRGGYEVPKEAWGMDEGFDELEPIPPEQPLFGDPTQFQPLPFDPNDPMMYMGSGKGDDAFLKAAKAYAKKAGYKDWNNLKYANDGVHKLDLNGVKFGRKGYGDFINYGLKESDKEAQKHRKAYLARATKIKGDWKNDPMSKNNLAIKVLWGGSAQPALPPNVALQSKEENPQVEEIIEEPMDDTDIRAYYPNAKIIRYSDLAKYKSITQVLPKDKSFAFILYQHAPNNGHWTLIMRYGDTIEFFCSYGSQIDAPLKWTNPRDRQMLGEAVPYLTNLLKNQHEFKVIHNPVQYQSKGSNKATCGAHDVMRLSQMLNHGQDLTDYYDYMTKIKKESGLSYDEIVANFVSQR
jgi:hypothetical protein